VVRGVGLDHNLQITHDGSPLSYRWPVRTHVGANVERLRACVNENGAAVVGDFAMPVL
jgi:hypothetical protein